jgi:hypothetical protein
MHDIEPYYPLEEHLTTSHYLQDNVFPFKQQSDGPEPLYFHH